jgi:antitoxin Phd
MRNWLAKDARAHLSDVIDEALKGEPQRVTRRGKGAVVVVSEEQWRRANSKQSGMTLGEYLATYPLSRKDIDLMATRGRERPIPFIDDMD